MYCKHCGKEILDQAVICTHCGKATDNHAPHRTTSGQANGAKNRLVYVLLAVLLGHIGIHNFFAGYNGRGIAQLLITIFTGIFVFPIFAVWVWALVEAVVIKQDAKGIPFT